MAEMRLQNTASVLVFQNKMERGFKLMYTHHQELVNAINAEWIYHLQYLTLLV